MIVEQSTAGAGAVVFELTTSAKANIARTHNTNEIFTIFAERKMKNKEAPGRNVGRRKENEKSFASGNEKKKKKMKRVSSC